MDVLDGIYPELAATIRELVLHANYHELNVDAQSGLRSMEKQAALYAQGRTEPGEIVTNAKPGHSWHNWGLAVDVAFRDSRGMFFWPPEHDPMWDKLGALGTQLGLEWGGRFHSIIDNPHFQLTYGIKLEKAIELGTPEAVWDYLEDLNGR